MYMLFCMKSFTRVYSKASLNIDVSSIVSISSPEKIAYIVTSVSLKYLSLALPKVNSVLLEVRGMARSAAGNKYQFNVFFLIFSVTDCHVTVSEKVVMLAIKGV